MARIKNLFCLLFLTSLMPLGADTYQGALSQIKNPRVQYKWVSADKGIFKKGETRQLNSLLNQLEKKTGVEFAVVVKKDLPISNAKELAHRLFNKWGIGKKEKNNGLLFLMIIEKRQWAFETGYGLESTLPDSRQGSIARAHMIPEFRKGEYGQGVIKGVEAINKVILNTPADQIGAPTPAQATPANTKAEEKKSKGYFAHWRVYDFIIVGLLLTIVLGLIGLALSVLKDANGLEKAEKLHLALLLLLLNGSLLVYLFMPINPLIRLFDYAVEGYSDIPFIVINIVASAIIFKRFGALVETPKKQLTLYLVVFGYILVILVPPFYYVMSYDLPIPVAGIGILFLGAIFPVHFAARKKIRYGKHFCSECSSEMRLLDEKEDDAWLKEGQITEEKINSRDYDVWMCQKCEDVVIEPFQFAGRTSKCEKCNFITFRFIENRVLKSATYSSSGSGVKIYRCAHCKHAVKDYYTIPQKTKSSSSSSSGSYSSGGSFSSSSGGSFGGGSSGGGGASGSW